MWMAKSHRLGVAGLALWLAMPAAWAGGRSGRFDGAWRVEFEGNQFCYKPHAIGRWSIRNDVIATGHGPGTVDARGRIDVRYPGPFFGHMNVIVGRIAGNRGTGSNEVEGTQCRETMTLHRISD
jgi:hypothetical protein